MAHRVVVLQRAAYAVEAELIGFDGIPPMHDTVADITAHRINWVGAFDGDELVGGAGYEDRADHRLIDRLFVDPARARQGIGRSLVQELLDAPEVRVSTGTANRPARGLYESLGFAPDGVKEIAPGVTVTRFTFRAEQGAAG